MHSTQSSNTTETKQELSDAYAAIRRQPPWSHPKSPDISHHRVLPHATYSPWLLDTAFQAVYQNIKDHTLVDIYRCYELWTLGQQMRCVPGNFLEVGVWRGGTGAILANAANDRPEKHVYLADTFRGVVKAGDGDTVYKGGEHADTSSNLVLELLHKLKLTNCILLEGIFPEDTGAAFVGDLALLHCDVDVYSSAKGVVEWAAPRLSHGGAIVFDDYGFSGCEGVTRLANELREDPNYVFVHNLNGHAIFIKK